MHSEEIQDEVVLLVEEKKTRVKWENFVKFQTSQTSLSRLITPPKNYSFDGWRSWSQKQMSDLMFLLPMFKNSVICSFDWTGRRS